jgi:hypothetical protein
MYPVFIVVLVSSEYKFKDLELKVTRFSEYVVTVVELGIVVINPYPLRFLS